MIQQDVSVSTMLISAVIALVGWGLKKTATALVVKIVELIIKLTLVDGKMAEITSAVAEVPRIKADVNEYYRRLKKLEHDFANHEH